VQAKAQERREAKIAMQQRLEATLLDGVKVVIDLDFPGKMTEREVTSLVQQLSYSVSCNRKAAAPCALHFTRYDAMQTVQGFLTLHQCENLTEVCGGDIDIRHMFWTNGAHTQSLQVHSPVAVLAL
jgi:Trm5-related predicted tRNA methylase